MKKLILILSVVAIVFPSCKKTTGTFVCSVTQKTTPNGPMEGITWYQTFPAGTPTSTIIKFKQENTWKNSTGILVITSVAKCDFQEGAAR